MTSTTGNPPADNVTPAASPPAGPEAQTPQASNAPAPEASKSLTPEAERALAEAEARRQQAATQPKRPNETGGRSGPDPVRYGDWEKGGIASDF